MKNACALASMLLAACSTPDVIDMGNGSYTLVQHATSREGAREDATQDAREFCESRGGNLVIRSFDDREEAAIRFTTAITFQCPHS